MARPTTGATLIGVVEQVTTVGLVGTREAAAGDRVDQQQTLARRPLLTQGGAEAEPTAPYRLPGVIDLLAVRPTSSSH